MRKPANPISARRKGNEFLARHDHVADAPGDQGEFRHIGDDAEIAQGLEQLIEEQAALQHRPRIGAVGADAEGGVRARFDPLQEGKQHFRRIFTVAVANHV